MAREKELEEEAGRTAKKRAEYWRHIGALAFLQDTHKALAAYQKAVGLHPDNPDGWRYLGELQHRLGEYEAARSTFTLLQQLGDKASDLQTQCRASLRLEWIERATGNLTEAEALAIRGLQFAESAEWHEGMADAYSSRANNPGILARCHHSR